MVRFAPRLLSLSLLAATPLVASNITVDTTDDTIAADGFCSLREAITAANGDAASNECIAGTGTSDRILFDLTFPATITVGSDLPAISESVAVVGPGVDLLAIDGGDLYRLLLFDFSPTESDPWFVVSGLSLLDAESNDAGPALAVYEGTLVLRDSVIAGGVSNFVCGGLYVDSFAQATIERLWLHHNTSLGVAGVGGAYFQGAAKITDSTVSDNSAPNGQAGGIRAEGAGTFELVRSTVSGNSAKDAGGGIEIFEFDNGETSQVTISSSTITDNECGAGFDVECGGGLRVTSSLGGMIDLTMSNTVLAENRDLTAPLQAHDLLLNLGVGSTVTSGGFNLVGDGSWVPTEFPAGNPNLNGDFVGTLASPLDPYLGLLGDDGGPTPTHSFVAPPPMTPHSLVDQGFCLDEPADQRGFGAGANGPRIVDVGAVPNNPNGGDGCDIGAFEGAAVAVTSVAIFADSFESGRFLFWSSDVP